MYSVTQGVKTYPCPFIKFFQCILVQVTDTQTAHISTVHQNLHFLYNDYDLVIKMYQTQNLILEIIAWYMSKKHVRSAHTVNKVQSDLPIYNHVIAQNINNLVSVFFLKTYLPETFQSWELLIIWNFRQCQNQCFHKINSQFTHGYRKKNLSFKSYVKEIWYNC